MPTKEISFFKRSSHPYYIAAPVFRHSSGGIRALHYLCHMLNELGLEAYIVTEHGGTNPHLRTPELTPDIRKEHESINATPIAVYPEGVTANFLNTPVVARWLLNKPIYREEDSKFDGKELLFYWDEWIVEKNHQSHRLRIPIVDRRIFSPPPPENIRSGYCFYANKYFTLGKSLSKNVISGGTSLCLNIPRSPEEIANVLRSAEVLYCYEPSSMVMEALLCDCPVAYVDTPYLDNFNWEKHPIFRVKEEDVGQAMPPPLNRQDIKDHFDFIDREGLSDISRFVTLTQTAAKKVYDRATINRELGEEPGRKLSTGKASHSEATVDETYQTWLAARTLTPEDLQQLAPLSGEATSTTFQILLRLPAGAEAHLADTLDSLGQQYLESWRLDIVTPLPAPDGLAELPNIGWHEVAAGQPVNMASLVEAAVADWVLEIPPGTRLDPLYLWRIATEAARSPTIQAFFVDDDCMDPAGQRQAPRFKPGCNPSRLLASDLAGPLCVRRPAYLTVGAAPGGSPWFRQLLAIAEQHGWTSIGHVADILLTYPQSFPSDTEACLHALLDFLGREAPGAEIVPVTGNAWNIRYPLPSPAPKVCIALLSQGQLDLLARCLNSILKLTHYPDYEVLLVVDAKTGDSELDDWLSNNATAAAPGKIRILRQSPPGNHATRCNQAMAASDADYVVLLREEAAVVQEQWLDELLRPLLQPGIAVVAPLMITPGKAEIWAAGSVLGLMGSRGNPEQQKIKLGQPGYLEYAVTPRDTSTLSSGCVLWRRADYLACGGMDEIVLGDHLADADLFLKLRAKQCRLIFQPASVVVFNGPESPTLDYDPAYQAQAAIAGERAVHEVNARWGRAIAVDSFWNPNLSLTTHSVLPETKYRAQWQFLPSDRPRIFACPIPNGQGDYRITSPLKAARKLGLANECVWMQSTENPNYLTVPELLRLAPDTAIIQNYIFDRSLAALNRWHQAAGRPFTVYALDDLITGLHPSNPFFKNIPANARARLQYALDRCDRMVVSTEFLADRYSSFIRDIRIFPNCLEQEIWLPLRSRKRTGKRPRIGWAGGSTHHADLLLLREIIERTRDEADWVFFGMCPDEVRPLLAEFHNTIAFEDYPAYLAALNFDIAVAPLAQTEFNRGKSNLRLLEYGILGIPVVCTDIDPYRNSPACRVPNTVEAWVEALRARIHDADARELEGLAMRNWVCQNHLLENRVNDWLDAHLPD